MSKNTIQVAQINAAIYRRKHPVLAMQNGGNIEHIFSKPSSKKQIQNKQHKSIKTSSKKLKEKNTQTGSSCTALDDCSSTKRLSSTISSSVRSSKSSTIAIADANIEKSERDNSDNELSLDSGNEQTLQSPVCVGDQTVIPENTLEITPEITPEIAPEIALKITPIEKDIEMTDSASICRSNQTRSSYPRSDGSRFRQLNHLFLDQVVQLPNIVHRIGEKSKIKVIQPRLLD